MNKKILALLISSSLLTACGGSDDVDVIQEEIANKAPNVVMQAPTSIVEKGTGTLSVDASDSDGTIAQYVWEQTSGPTLAITGGNTASISFEVPSVALDTPISFKVTVTDDDGATASVNLNTTIERIETNYKLTGTVVGDTFSGANLKAMVANEATEVTINNDGTFALELMVDDDVPLSKLVKLTTLKDSTINLTLLLPSLENLSTAVIAPAASAKINRINTQTRAAEVNASALSISAVSTALYSLLVASNDGVEPDNIVTIELIEGQLNPDKIIRATAIVKILLENDSIVLPEGIDNVVDLLIDDAALTLFVAAIEANDPHLIDNQMDAVIADPALTPPLDASAVAEVYYQASPTAPTFVARTGSRYHFDANGEGSQADNFGIRRFNWEVVDGTIKIAFIDSSVSFSVVDGMDDLTEAEKSALIAEGYNQVEIITSPIKRTLTRLTSGTAVDAFYDETVIVHQMTPVTLSTGVTISHSWTEQSGQDTLMRKSATGNAMFVSNGMTGKWALNLYNEDSEYYGTRLEILDFKTDGTGVSEDSAKSFNWSVADGVLKVVFADFTQTFTIIDTVNADYLTYSEVTNNVGGEIITVIFGIGLLPNSEIAFDETNSITGATRYWQTMINQWTADSWDNGRLQYCYYGITNDQGECSAGANFYGFQTLDNNTGTLYRDADGTPSMLANYRGSALNWSLVSDNKVMRYEYADSCSNTADSVCHYREWRLLDVKDGLIGKRFYVQETYYSRSDTTSEWYYAIEPRLNQYELIDLEYFNNSVKTVDPLTNNIIQPSKVYYPSMIVSSTQ